MTEITYRLAASGDAGVLYDMLRLLAHDLGKEHEFSGSREALLKYGFSETPAFEAIIAWRGEEPLGFILYFYEFSTWRGAPGIYVQDLYVKQEARGLGLGHRLTCAAMALAKKREAVYMRLMVHGDNQAGFGFYNAIGFKAVEGETVMLLEMKDID
ncbi:GNAT family N-acetyltransferase [Emcibacter nanhaiensis]|uniref:GNAT family N-acetyltransferase n=1 Tax=Emcibacter nanhaiensis TaxID=1505037 RepID=A0A501PL14_9PROT|nr:GNAT family N-acetyltransferase [Emcibacter nanhaiensis]TPD60757.1 GNAT family N-acetyltransferase [Emcibacter nanhaiensis]